MFKFEYNMPASLFLEEAADLLYTHWKELAVNQDKVFLDANVLFSDTFRIQRQSAHENV